MDERCAAIKAAYQAPLVHAAALPLRTKLTTPERLIHLTQGSDMYLECRRPGLVILTHVRVRRPSNVFAISMYPADTR